MLQRAVSAVGGGSSTKEHYVVAPAANNATGIVYHNDAREVTWSYTVTGQKYNDDNITVSNSGTAVTISFKKECTLYAGVSNAVTKAAGSTHAADFSQAANYPALVIVN